MPFWKRFFGYFGLKFNTIRNLWKLRCNTTDCRFDLTEDQELIRETARDFTEQFVAPGVLDRDQSREFPHQLVRQLGEMGLMGMVHAEEYGGAGADTVSFALVLEEIGRWDASLALTVALTYQSVLGSHRPGRLARTEN